MLVNELFITLEKQPSKLKENIKLSNYLFITKVSNYLLQTKHIKLVLNYYIFYQIIYYKQKKLNYLIIIYFF